MTSLYDLNLIIHNNLSSSSSSWRLSKIFLFLSLLQFMIHPTLSQTNTTPTPSANPTDDEQNDGQYNQIYLTMIIIFSILFVVVIFCLIYRIYKKRQEENGDDSKVKQNGNSSNTENGATNGNIADEAGGVTIEQVKFRGSMSSVENRHERVPSKPVVIAITTPKGTRHVADAFGDYNNQNDPNGAHSVSSGGKDENLPEIHENQEEDYDDGHEGNNNSQQTTNNANPSVVITPPDNNEEDYEQKIVQANDDGDGGTQ